MAGSVLGAQGTSFGLDFAVIDDPVENLVFIGMIQQFGSMLPNVRATSKRLLYQAILDPYGI